MDRGEEEYCYLGAGAPAPLTPQLLNQMYLLDGFLSLGVKTKGVVTSWGRAMRVPRSSPLPFLLLEIGFLTRSWPRGACRQETEEGQEVGRADHIHLPNSPQAQKVGVSRDQIPGAACQRTGCHGEIIRIAKPDGRLAPDDHGLSKRDQLLFDEPTDLSLGQVKLWIGENAEDLLKDRSGEKELKAAGLPSTDQVSDGAAKQECRQDDVRVENGMDHLRLPRAHRMAAVRSASVRPSRWIFSLTTRSRSPGAVTATGLNTTSPSRTVTSKYSVGGSASTTLLGSVIWFFEVFLANMFLTSLL